MQDELDLPTLAREALELKLAFLEACLKVRRACPAWRTRHNLTQKQMGKMLGVSQMGLGHLEREPWGGPSVSATMLERMSELRPPNAAGEEGLEPRPTSDL